MKLLLKLLAVVALVPVKLIELLFTPIEQPPALPDYIDVKAERLNSVETELLAVAEAAQGEPTLQAHDSTEPRSLSPIERSKLVKSLLDEAYSQGCESYQDLMAYVAAQSGQPCGKRAIANWKRERGLIAA
ncbi:MAG: hypothetical protein HC881_16015 [Leptolyngbyaceae cyanobacterium SL_7_1]|nr:hypothetical protein [Leptolyngbyaceae cyanobacterium SL_7_1]